MMQQDRYGLDLTTGSAAAAAAYIDGVDRFLSAEEGVERCLTAAVEADPNFALGWMALARHHQMYGRRDDLNAAREKAMALAPGVTAREASQLNALNLILTGKVGDGYAAIRAHLLEYPRDAMICQTCTGVFGLIGFSGQPGREAELLAFTTSLAPHYGDDWWFLGQHAFSMMEAGQTGPADRAIETSLAARPRNAHSAHIRSHLYYETGEVAAGRDYLTDWMPGYKSEGLLHCHLSWHQALWALEQGDEAAMWSVVDTAVQPGSTHGPAVNVLTDTASILYRAEMRGIDVPRDRWRMISDYALACFPKPGLAFADVHAALAHAMAGNTTALDRIRTDARGPAGDVVPAFANSFAAIAAQDWSTAEQHLTVAMADHARIGGSRAQRDLLEHTMTNVLLRQGKGPEAERLLKLRRPQVLTAA